MQQMHGMSPWRMLAEFPGAQKAIGLSWNGSIEIPPRTAFKFFQFGLPIRVRPLKANESHEQFESSLKSIGYTCEGTDTWTCNTAPVEKQESSTSWIGFKGPFYQTALNDIGSYYTIKTREIEDDSYWQMVHVDSQSNKEKFIPENPEKYVASGLSVMKISNDESNLFYEYAAPKAGIHFLFRVL